MWPTGLLPNVYNPPKHLCWDLVCDRDSSMVGNPFSPEDDADVLVDHFLDMAAEQVTRCPEPVRLRCTMLRAFPMALNLPNTYSQPLGEGIVPVTVSMSPSGFAGVPHRSMQKPAKH